MCVEWIYVLHQKVTIMLMTFVNGLCGLCDNDVRNEIGRIKNAGNYRYTFVDFTVKSNLFGVVTGIVVE